MPLELRLVALLGLLLLVWWPHRRRRVALPPEARVRASECSSCGEGYHLKGLRTRGQDGAQRCVKCPECASWYLVATTTRHVVKVDEGYVSTRWPDAITAVTAVKRYSTDSATWPTL